MHIGESSPHCQQVSNPLPCQVSKFRNVVFESLCAFQWENEDLQQENLQEWRKRNTRWPEVETRKNYKNGPVFPHIPELCCLMPQLLTTCVYLNVNYYKPIHLEIHFLSHTSYISTAQFPHVANHYYIGQHRYSTSPPQQKLMLDSTILKQWAEVTI